MGVWALICLFWYFGSFRCLGLLGVLGLLVQRLKPPNHNSDPYSGPVFFCVCSIFSPVFKRLLGLFLWVFGLSFVFFGILDLLRVLGLLGVLGLLVQRLKPNNHNFDPYSGPVFFVKVKSIRGSLFYRFIVRENIVLTHVFFTFFTPTLVFSKTLFLNFKG